MRGNVTRGVKLRDERLGDGSSSFHLAVAEKSPVTVQSPGFSARAELAMRHRRTQKI